MDNNNCDNSFELYARHHAPRDAPASNEARSAGIDTIDTISQSNQPNTDEFTPPATISIISDPQRGAPPPPPARAPSIKFKLNRRQSQRADSDATDRSDASGKTINNRMKGRSALTSSFLRRKQFEYAGTQSKHTQKKIPKTKMN